MARMTKIQKIVRTLPDKPGVYLFYDEKKKIIYVGKASSLKSRVGSYFTGLRHPRPIELLIDKVKDIKWVVSDSALEAAILESNYIKKYRPKYNIYWKDDKSWNYFLISKEEYPELLTMREHELKAMPPAKKKKYQYIFGPYPGLNTKAALRLIERLFFVSFCRPRAKRACLNRQMGFCLGVCTGEISPRDYRRKVIKPLTVFLQGKKKSLIKSIEREMKTASSKKDFEEAARLRDQLKALSRIRDMALINESFIKDVVEKNIKVRIEGYDISNLGQSGKVGSMVVFDECGPLKSEYRKFNIKKLSGRGDADYLAEVFERRLRRDDWPPAQVWLIDGGLPQVNKALKVAAGKIPVIIGIAKGAKRQKNKFIIGTKNTATIDWLKKHKNLLIQVRDEAHRFALSFQRQKRKI